MAHLNPKVNCCYFGLLAYNIVPFFNKNNNYMGRIKISEVQRFESKFEKTPNQCWLWLGHTDKDGYGKFDVLQPTGKYRSRFAHRYSYQLYKGTVTDCVLHICDTPACVNPEHLFLGTNVDNSNDKCAKQRQSVGESCPAHKLTNVEVLEIRAKQGNGQTQWQIADDYGVHQSIISGIFLRKMWKHI